MKRSLVLILNIAMLSVVASSYVHISSADDKQPDSYEKVKLDSPIPLHILPKDQNGVVDWTEAVKKGYIKPLNVIYPKVEEENKKEGYIKDIKIKTDTGSPSGVIFSHISHNYWFDCANCHPQIFKEEKGANRTSMTMEKMENGEACGRCHNKVAFSMQNCDKCHSDDMTVNAVKAN